jgi:hypothetical protein
MTSKDNKAVIRRSGGLFPSNAKKDKQAWDYIGLNEF